VHTCPGGPLSTWVWSQWELYLGGVPCACVSYRDVPMSPQHCPWPFQAYPVQAPPYLIFVPCFLVTSLALVSYHLSLSICLVHGDREAWQAVGSSSAWDLPVGLAPLASLPGQRLACTHLQ
jgi:hypothetical protein